MDTSIQKYKAFVKTMECGSFTRAAELLGYTQSAVSRMISGLETDWNITLFERHKSGLRMTGDGTRLLPYARRLCEEYDRLQMEVDDLNGLQTGFIRIGTIASVCENWLPNMIRAFQEDFPGIDYELLIGDYSEIAGWIRDGRVDCGFLVDPLPSDLDCEVLTEDELVAVLPKGHELADLERVPLEAMKGYPFLMLKRGKQSEVEDLFRDRGVEPDVHLTLWDDYALAAMVEQGLGISILPRLILRRMPYDIEIRSIEEPASRKIAVVCRDRETISLAARHFLDYTDMRERRI
jgi:DNA-binding transcriptional LysR family regulator